MRDVSYPGGMIEHVFDVNPAQLGDEALISALTAATRAEARAAAWRLVLVGEVTARQCEDEDDEFAHQVIDGWAWAKAQVGAACNLSPYAASKQMGIAVALRDRLPRTAALFAAGAVSAAVIEAITWRTRLVEDGDALALIDAAIAGEACGYGLRSEAGLITAVDVWVEKFDPAAVLRSKAAASDIYVEFDDKDDPNGVASFWGRLRVTDKQALQRRLDALAATVCANDPRTVRQRRADALATLGVVGPQLERLTCLCGDPGCVGSGKDPRATAVTIHVVADHVPVAGEQASEAETVATGPRGEPVAAEGAPVTPVEVRPPAGPGVLLDGAVVPAAMLADLVATGAKVKPVADPADPMAEPRHDPSEKLTAVVRARHLMCAFPGCGRAADRCDVDHVVAWPAGATHPGNLQPLCREHHLLKTFCGWTPQLAPDGTVTWTAPTGHTYTKVAGASILGGAITHIEIPPARPITPPGGADRGQMMPRRARTRAQECAQRIKAERARNTAERSQSGSDPPF
ncbi:HNH endonuclease signature motif containing protein [Mycolicibacterium cosmeticum]|uniref:HNH endonuclease signature motif containing protein n=1 Tax=Mycolicibacterium cosmeticum TaxID=258533 RepID=UPI0032049AEA